MNTKSTDRRVRKTKKAIKDGLIELMLEKSLNDISVRELTDKVDINRGTFYLHYKDIFDLVEKIEEEIFLEFSQVLNSYSAENLNGRPLPLLEGIFEFLKNNSSMAAVLLSSNGDIGFVNKLKDLVRKKCFNDWTVIFSITSDTKVNYYYNFIVSGYIGLFETWLQNGLKESPYEMALLAESIILRGVDVIKEKNEGM